MTARDGDPWLFDWKAKTPGFDGETYNADLDHARLGRQFIAVFKAMKDGAWHTLREIAETAEAPEASVSARMRDFRKEKFGGHTVERENLGDGLFRYRLVINPSAAVTAALVN